MATDGQSHVREFKRAAVFLLFLISLVLITWCSAPAAIGGKKHAYGALRSSRSTFFAPKGRAKAKITKPEDGSLVTGSVDIKGTATAPDFSRYTLSCAPKDSPQNPVTIGEYTIPTEHGKLATWQTQAITDGDYILKLTVFSTVGPQAEDSVNIGIDNNPPVLSFSSPSEGAVVRSPFDVVGTISDAHLKRWRLDRASNPPTLLAHLDGNTINERTGEEGATTGDPTYSQAKFSQGLHITTGQGLSYPRKGNIRKAAGTIEMWVVPDWAETDQETHVLLQTRTDPNHPTDCVRIAEEAASFKFTICDASGNPRTCSLPASDAGIGQGTPFHIAATWDDGKLSLAVNGVAAGQPQGSGTGKLSSLGERIFIGYSPQVGNEADATIDEISIYNYARPLSSLRADFLADAPKNMGSGRERVARGKDPIQNALIGTVNTTDQAAEAVSLTLSARDRLEREAEIEERVFLDNASPYAVISSPAEGSEVMGEVQVKGSAFDMDLSSYTLSFKAGNDPNSSGDWTQVTASEETVWRDDLATWNAGSLPSGDFCLKLEVSDKAGKKSSSYRRVRVVAVGPPYAEITSPHDGDVVDLPLEVRGTVRGGISGYTLSYREISPLFLSHFEGNTKNERDGSAGETWGSPYFTQGKFAQGIFIGTNDGLKYPSSGNINKDTGTVEMWVTPSWSGSDSNAHILFATEPSSGMSNFMALLKAPGAVLFYVFDSSENPKVVSLPVDDTNLPAGIPFHVAATWSNGDIHLYFNGEEGQPMDLPDFSGTGIISQAGAHIFAGSVHIAGEDNPGAEGAIDEMSIYGYVREREAITEDYHAEAPKIFTPEWTQIAQGTGTLEDAPVGTLSSNAPPGEKLELKLTAQGASGQVSEHAIALTVDASAPTAEITYPADGGFVYGSIDVKGTATDIDFASYELSYKEGADPNGPNPWVSIGGPQTHTVVKGILGTWDSSSLPNGDYCLRLRVNDKRSKSSTAYCRVRLAGPPYAEITSPHDGDVVDLPLEVRGTVRGGISGYTLSYRESGRETSPLFLSHFEGNTKNERDGSAGETWGSPSFTQGKFAQGIFIGTSDGLKYPSQGNINKDTGTVEMWVTPSWSGSDSNAHILFATEPSSGISNFMALLKAPGAVLFYVFDSSGKVKVVSLPVDDTNLPSGVPFHVAATWSNGDVHLYFNGEEGQPMDLPDFSGTGIISQVGAHIFAGSVHIAGEGLPGAEGAIDELSIYGCVREREAITEDCHAEAPKIFTPEWTQIAQGTGPLEDACVGTLSSNTPPGEKLELKLTAQGASGQVSEHAIALTVDASAPTAEITYPADGGFVYGSIDVKGTATDIDFASYELSYKEGADPNGPNPWVSIGGPQTHTVVNGVLGNWDAGALPNGDYCLRLEVSDRAGKSPSAYCRVRKAGPPYAEITSPHDGDVVDLPLEVRGTVRGGITGYTLSYRETSPLFLSHFEGNTKNERDGSAGETWGSPSFTQGKFAQGIFIGTSDGLKYPSQGNINKDTGTVELWCTPSWSGSDSNTHVLFATESTSETSNWSNCMLLFKAPNAVAFYVFDAGGQPKVVSLPVDDTNLPSGVPFHVAATWSNGDIRLYFNGEEGQPDAQKTGTGILSELGGHIFAGSSDIEGAGSAGAEGAIDELSIDGCVRARDAITKDYHAEAPKSFTPEWTQIAQGTGPLEDAPIGTLSSDAPPGEKLELKLTAQGASGQVSEHAIALTVDASAPTAEITYPADGGFVYGSIDVKGTATDIDFASYELSYKEGADPNGPSPWVSIGGPQTHTVVKGILGTWDSSSLPNGDYRLRLEVSDRRGKSSTAYCRVRKAGPPYAEITSPHDGDVVDLPLEVRGTVRGGISGYTLSYRQISPLFLSHFDGNTKNERDGSPGETWGSPSFTQGKFAQGIFIGTNDGLKYPSSGNINKDTGTVELWCTPSWSGSDGNGHMLFATEPSSGMSNCMLLLKASNIIAFLVGDSSGKPKAVSLPVDDTNLPSGVPFHVAATWSNGDIHLYFNGEEGQPMTIPGIGPGTGILSQVGGHFFAGSGQIAGEGFPGAEGAIDELSIYGFARAKEAITKDYHAEAPKSFTPEWTIIAQGTGLLEDAPIGTLSSNTPPGEKLELKLAARNDSGQTAEHAVTLTIDASAPTAEITYPADGGLVYGSIDVKGTATDIDFASYELSYKQGADPNGPNPWVSIGGPQTHTVVNGVLGTWDAGNLPNGDYCLRLRVNDKRGKTAAFDKSVRVNNDVPTAEITFPVQEEGAAETCEIRGSACGPNFSSYKLSYKQGSDPQGSGAWQQIGEAHTDPVENGILATWDTTSLPEGPFCLRLTVTGIPGMEITKTVSFYIDHTQPVALISTPDGSKTLTGLVRIEGTATDAHFKAYTLEYAPQDNPNEWHPIGQARPNTVDNALLSWWNTEGIADGAYVLRLSSEDTVGHVVTCNVTVTLSNPTGYVIESMTTDPQGMCLEVGETIDFIAIARDTQGNDHLVPASWQITGENGSIDDTGHFTATARGLAGVRATYQTFTCEALVSVITRVGSCELTTNTTWTPAENPWVVDGWVVVPQGVTLTLSPGTVVKFKRGGIYVEGTLQSASPEGSPEITITSFKDDGVMGDTNADGGATSPGRGDYSCIYYTQGASQSTVYRTRVTYAGKPTDEAIPGGRRVSSQSAIFTAQPQSYFHSCTVAESGTYGIFAMDSELRLESCTFSGITDSCALVMDYSPSDCYFVGNRMEGCRYGIIAYGAGDAEIRWNHFSGVAGTAALVYCPNGGPNGVVASSNEFSSCSGGLVITGQVTGGIEVSSNTFTSCSIGQYTIMIDATEGSTLVFSNTFNCPNQDGHYGICVSPGTNDTQVYDNNISGYRSGIMAGSFGRATVRNNTISYEGSESFSVGIWLNNQESNNNVIGDELTCASNVVSGYSVGIWLAADAQHYMRSYTISNNTILGRGEALDYSFGIMAGGPPDITLLMEGNNISGHIFAVHSSNIDRVTAKGNTVHTCPNKDGYASGIRIDHTGSDKPGATAEFTGNSIEGAGYSVWSDNYESVTLSGNTITCSSPDQYGIGALLVGPSKDYSTGECEIRGNNVTGKNMAGLYSDYFKAVTVAQNTVTPSSPQGSAIQFWSQTAAVTSNNVSNAWLAIWCKCSSTAQIEGNRVSSCQEGIYCRGARGASIKNNDLKGTGTTGTWREGLHFDDVEGSATGNEISGFDYGVYAQAPNSTPSVKSNRIQGNRSYGLYYTGTDYMDARDNWWGNASGPAPYGSCNAVWGHVRVEPWAGKDEWHNRRNGPNPKCPHRGEPVNLNTGNFSSGHTDLDFEGTGPHITIARTYNSLDAGRDGPFGYGWSYTYSARIEHYLPEYVDGDMLLIGPESDYHRYMNNGNGTYSPEDQDYSLLTHNPDGTWLISHKDGSLERYDSSGLMVQVADTNNNVLNITRDSSGKVTSVTDACGQSATFSYNTAGKIEGIIDPAGRTVHYAYDENGNLTEVTDLNGGNTRYTYDERHRILTVTDPKGASFVNNTYDEQDRVVSQVDSLGKEVHFSYDMAAHSHVFTDASGKNTTYLDDWKLAEKGETDPLGRSTSVTYDSDGNMTSLTDKTGNTTSNTYDTQGNMLSETDPLGNTTSYTYDARGNRLTTTDPLGNTTRMTYDERNNMLTETDPLGKTTTYTYDPQGRQLTETDPLGRTTQNVYDSRGNLVQVINPDGGVTTDTYDQANRKTSTTDPEGNTTTYAYDTMGHLISTTDPEGNTTTHTYDPDGNEVSVTDPLGNTTRTEYDLMGRVSSEIDPLGHVKTYEYDANGNRTKETDPLGNTTTHVYDKAGREIETRDPRGNSSYKTYDKEGRLLTETDAEGKITTNTYDTSGKIVSKRDPLGNTTTYTYDATDRQTSVTDPLGHTTTSAYDSTGRLVSTTDPEGHTNTTSYDDTNDRVSETDPEGHTTTSAYDQMGNLASMTDPDGRVTTYTYDRNGNKTSTTDGTGATTTFTYNRLGMLKSVTDPVGSRVAYSYDDSGRKTSMTDPRGAVTTYSYDPAGNLSQETNPIGEITSYSYDAAGRITTKTDGEGTTTYTCDENGNTTSASYPGGLTETNTYDKNDRPTTHSGGGVTITLSYDAAGNVKSASNGNAATAATYDAGGNITTKTLAYPGVEKSFSYTYDPDGKMTVATDETGKTAAYSYSPAGRMTSKAYPNGIETDYAYDAGGSLSGLNIKKQSQNVKSYSLSRDARSNITAVTEDGTQTTSYTYDSASKLTGENNPWTGNTTYSYDSSGNRISKEKAGQAPITYTYNAADELTQDSQGNTYSYNARGDLARIENGSYRKDLSWDGKGRLKEIRDTDNLSCGYTYDPLDRVYTSTEDNKTARHVYDMTTDKEIALLGDSNDLKTLFHTGADGLISATKDGNTSYFSYNPHSDVSLMTDESGNTTKELHYDAWGNTAEQSTEPYTYLGKHQRRTYGSPGLIKMGARFYDPDTGRFISRDPLKGHDEIPISHNQYVYSYEDPVNKTDISGESPGAPSSTSASDSGPCPMSCSKLDTKRLRNNIVSVARSFLGVPFHWEGRGFGCPGNNGHLTGTYGEIVDKDHNNCAGRIRNGSYRHTICFDCCGFVASSFYNANYPGARDKNVMQGKTADKLFKNCHTNREIHPQEALPGDLCFSHDREHVAIYYRKGGGVIESPGTGGWVSDDGNLTTLPDCEQRWKDGRGYKWRNQLEIFRPKKFSLPG